MRQPRFYTPDPYSSIVKRRESLNTGISPNFNLGSFFFPVLNMGNHIPLFSGQGEPMLVCHLKERRKSKRESYAETHRQPPDMVSLQTQTGSELPDLLTCTTLHSNNLQNSSTHNA
jgi:hypothetical protein